MGERLVRLIVASAIGGAVGLGLGGPPRVIAQGLPTVSIDDQSVVEGPAGSKTVTITVRLSGPSSAPVSVSWATPGVGLFLDGFFPIGPFAPTYVEMQKWADRGANTAIGENIYTDPANGRTRDVALRDWDQHASAAGMRTIRASLDNPAEDVGNTILLAWSQGDEPDQGSMGYHNLPIYQQNYTQWKTIDPTRPVFVNLAPNLLTAYDTLPGWCNENNTPYPYSDCTRLVDELAYVNTTMDWVSNDLYPMAGWLPDENRRNDVTYVGDPLDKIKSWVPNKPRFQIIECSDQNLFPSRVPPLRGVTPAEFRAEVWIAIVHGARGIVYFPQRVNEPGYSNDAMTPEVEAEMKIQNAVITSIAPVLQGEIDPSSIHASVPAPLQVCWRNATSGKYFIVVNPVAATQSGVSMTLTGVSAATATVINETPNRTVNITGNAITDTFTAHAVHIYKMD